jgi:hypothetical protein
MSTRSLLGVRFNGQDKLSYNHSDGYPSWMIGHELHPQLRAFFKDRDYDGAVAELRHRALNMCMVSQDSKPSAEDIQHCLDMGTVNLNVSEGSTESWYCLLRGHHGKLLDRLMAGVATDESSGMLDSNWSVEYAYTLNLDNDPCVEFYIDSYNYPNHMSGRYAELRAAMTEMGTRETPERFNSPLALVHSYPLPEFLALEGDTIATDMDRRAEEFDGKSGPAPALEVPPGINFLDLIPLPAAKPAVAVSQKTLDALNKLEQRDKEKEAIRILNEKTGMDPDGPF